MCGYKYTCYVFLFFIHLDIIHCYLPEIQMPYKKIKSGSSTNITKIIGKTLTCNEQMNSLKDCAIECYNRKFTIGCPGFYVDSTQNYFCYLCHISTETEVSGDAYTTFNTNDIIYIFKAKQIVPDVSLDFDNYTGNTFYGENIIGTASGIVESDHVSGIKGKALYIQRDTTGKVSLPGSGTSCWTNLDECLSGMTVSIWYQPKVELKSSGYYTLVHGGHDVGFYLQVANNRRVYWQIRTPTNRYCWVISKESV